jgi:hypothetical protein
MEHQKERENKKTKPQRKLFGLLKPIIFNSVDESIRTITTWYR